MLHTDNLTAAKPERIISASATVALPMVRP